MSDPDLGSPHVDFRLDVRRRKSVCARRRVDGNTSMNARARRGSTRSLYRASVRRSVVAGACRSVIARRGATGGVDVRVTDKWWRFPVCISSPPLGAAWINELRGACDFRVRVDRRARGA
jgi:hypothetical protein